MELINNGKGSLGTATVIHKDEEMPFTGSIGAGSNKDSNGMGIEGDSGMMGTGANRGNVSNVQ